MSAITINFSNPLHTQLVFEFLNQLNKTVTLNVKMGDTNLVTLYLNLDKPTIDRMAAYIENNS